MIALALLLICALSFGCGAYLSRRADDKRDYGDSP